MRPGIGGGETAQEPLAGAPHRHRLVLGDDRHPGDQPARVDRRALGQQDQRRPLQRVVGVLAAERVSAGDRDSAPQRCLRAARALPGPVGVDSAAVDDRREASSFGGCSSTPGSIPAAAAAPPRRYPRRRDEHLPDHRRRRIPRLAHVRPPAARGPPGDLRRQPRHRLAAEHRAHPRRRVPLHPARPHRAVLHRRAESTSSTTSPRRRARSTTCACRCTRSRSAPTAPTTCSGWRRRSAPGSCSPRPPRSTATPRSTRSRRATGATSTRSARAASTTRRSATPRR